MVYTGLDNNEFWKTIGISFLCFRIVYLISYQSGLVVRGYDAMSNAGKSMWGSSCCSSILSLWMPYLVVKIGLANGGKWLFFDYPYKWADDEVTRMACIMIGYFYADLCDILYYNKQWGKEYWVFAFHHIAAIWYFHQIIQHELGQGSLLAVCLVEFSNFFNNNRYYMSKIIMSNGQTFAAYYPTINLMN